MADQSNGGDPLTAFELAAEFLAAHQLDLLAQLERQLRAVHHTMRDIEKLRGAGRRVGPELSEQQREATLSHLTAAIAALDSHVGLEHECCAEMLSTIEKMREQMTSLREPSGPRQSQEAPAQHAG